MPLSKGIGQPKSDKGRRTRARFIEAGKLVFARDGFRKARIVDIAAEAGVATGSFYTHFGSKDDVFAAVLADLQDEMLHADVSGGNHPELRRRVEEANRAYLESYRRNAALMAAMEQAAAVNPRFMSLRQQRSQAFIDRTAAAIKHLQEAGLADPALDAAITARALSAMVSRTAYATFATGPPLPFETLVDTLTRLWMNALRMPQQ